MTENIVSGDSDELAKTRDFATVTGFLVIFMFSVLVVACNIKELTITQLVGASKPFLFTILFLVLMFAAGVLAYTKSRFIVSATFIMFSYSIIAPVIPSVIFKDPTLFTTLPMGIVMIVFALAIIAARRKEELACILVLLFNGVSLTLLGLMDDYDSTKWIAIALEIGQAVVAGLMVACFAVRSKKDKIYSFFVGNPAPEEDFWEAGTAVGTALMSMSMVASTLYYLNIGGVSTNEMAALETASGITLMLLSVILVLTTKSKFTPFLFLMIGVTFTLTSFVKDIGQILCIFTLLIGIICFLRNDGKNIIGAAIIIYGFSYLTSAQFTSEFDNGVLSTVLNLVPMALLMYLSFAYLSKAKLPIA